MICTLRTRTHLNRVDSGSAINHHINECRDDNTCTHIIGAQGIHTYGHTSVEYTRSLSLSLCTEQQPQPQQSRKNESMNCGLASAAHAHATSTHTTDVRGTHAYASVLCTSVCVRVCVCGGSTIMFVYVTTSREHASNRGFCIICAYTNTLGAHAIIARAPA